MSYAIDAVLVIHGLFILYVLLGGLLVFLSKHMVWPHLVTVAWGMWIELFAGTCPLTVLEWKLRLAAGMQQYQGGFIDHYLTAAIYPSGLSRETQHWLGPDPRYLEYQRLLAGDSLLGSTSGAGRHFNWKRTAAACPAIAGRPLG